MIGYDLYKRWRALPDLERDRAIQFFCGYGLCPIDGFKPEANNPDKEHAVYSAEALQKSIEYAEEHIRPVVISDSDIKFIKNQRERLLQIWKANAIPFMLIRNGRRESIEEPYGDGYEYLE